ncbi:MAG: hypothetical protein KJ811_05425, partial [Candidatus Margulisbacteria bacterium]|nr:hypothetical protein [Candidatus Margulisiibacteriota bacterium]
KPAVHHAAQSIRAKLPRFITGETTTSPGPFTARVNSGKLLLCRISDNCVFLNTSFFKEGSAPIIRCVKEGETIKALVYTAHAWSLNRKHEDGIKGPAEVFIVHNGSQIIYDAYPENQPEPAPSPAQAINPLPRQRVFNPDKVGPTIAKWATRPDQPTPEPIEKKVMPNGNIHICIINRKAVVLNLGHDYGEKDIKITFQKKHTSRFATVLVIETNEEFEFCFITKGRIIHRPKSKVIEAA